MKIAVARIKEHNTLVHFNKADSFDIYEVNGLIVNYLEKRKHNFDNSNELTFNPRESLNDCQAMLSLGTDKTSYPPNKNIKVFYHDNQSCSEIEDLLLFLSFRLKSKMRVLS